ncbi:hypothetical protein LG275_11695 [Chryseomicrobium palamuruense]
MTNSLFYMNKWLLYLDISMNIWNDRLNKTKQQNLPFSLFEKSRFVLV